MAERANDDVMITAGMLANRLRPIVLGGESSCLNGTPMIPLHRGTVTAVYEHLERLAALDGETTDRAREYPTTHDIRSDNLSIARRPDPEAVMLIPREGLEDALFDALYDSAGLMGVATRKAAKACVAALAALNPSPVLVSERHK